MRCVLREVSAGDGYGGDGGGFGAEDAGAEGYGLPLVLGEEGDFFRGPAAFGAYRYGGLTFYIPPFAVRLRRMGHPFGCVWFKDFLVVCARLGVFEGLGEGEGLFGFA